MRIFRRVEEFFTFFATLDGPVRLSWKLLCATIKQQLEMGLRFPKNTKHWGKTRSIYGTTHNILKGEALMCDNPDEAKFEMGLGVPRTLNILSSLGKTGVSTVLLTTLQGKAFKLDADLDLFGLRGNFSNTYCFFCRVL